MTIKTAADLKSRPANQTASQQLAAVQDARQQRMDAMREIIDGAQLAGRDLLASESRDCDAHDNEVRRLDVLADTIKTSDEYVTEYDTHMQQQRSLHLPGAPGNTRPGAYEPGRPLAQGQTFAGYVAARDRSTEDVPDEQMNLRMALRGIATGDWRGAEGIRNAMSGGTGSAGGFLVPAPLSAQIIDLARNQTAVLQAGARILPMESRTLDVAKWTGDPSPVWHTEASNIPPSDATLSKVTLTAHTLAGLTIVSRELLEDAQEVEDQLRAAFAADFSLIVDKAALYGSGIAPEPLGVKNTAGVTKTPLGANGATPANWDWLVDSVGRLADTNENANAAIYSPRTARTMAKLKDTTNQPMQLPEYVAEIARFQTNQVPNNLTVGTGTTTSDTFVGDWSQLYIGLRTELQIQVLTERFADTGQIGFLTWWRGDIQVARAAAFDVTTGILP